MEDDLSPASEPEPELSLREASALVGLSTKKLGERCADGRLRCRKGRRTPSGPLMWLTTESALREAELLGTSSRLEPANVTSPVRLDSSGTVAEALLARMDAFLERLGTYAERAGSAATLAELLTKERVRADGLAGDVAELRGRLEKAEAELERERTRPLTTREMWTGHRERGERP